VIGRLVRNNDPADLGQVNEVFTAALLTERGHTVTMVGIKKYDEMGVDAIVDGFPVQIKMSRNAMLTHAGDSPYPKLRKKLKKQRGEIKKEFGENTQWKLAMPDSAIADVQGDADLVALLTDVGLWPPAVANLPDLP